MINAYTKKPEHYSADKWKEYQRIVKSFDVRSVSKKHQKWVLQALHDEFTWDWYKDCNGANFVSEDGWIKSKKTGIAYHPAYVYHDYAWTRWGATWKSNCRMWTLQNVYNMNRLKSQWRWLGVTCFGMPYSWIKGWFIK